MKILSALAATLLALPGLACGGLTGTPVGKPAEFQLYGVKFLPFIGGVM